jgi:RND family efflux transporter MFP subunit
MNSFGRIFGVMPVLLMLGVLSTPSHAEEVEATLQWVRTVPLSTAVSGVIDTVDVSKGDRVQKNQVLLHLVSKTFQADVVAQKANLKKAENNKDEAERELERTQELYDRTLLSDHDLQLGIIQRDAATAELQVARSKLTSAERDLYYSVVRAPFDAWVLQRNAQPGQVVVVKLQASPLLVLAEAGRMLARSEVGGAMAGKLRLGTTTQVTVAGKKYTGKISYISLEPVKPGVDKYTVDVSFSSGNSVLRVGQAAKVTF